MFVRTSDRGEPAKINFCRWRTDSVENSPNSCSGGASRDRTFAGNCIALSMKSFLALLDSASRVLVPHVEKGMTSARSLTIFRRSCGKSRSVDRGRFHSADFQVAPHLL